jgi:phosphate transport system substrate-binding protein
VKRSLFRKGLASLAVVGIAATGLLVTGSPPAHAAPDNVLTVVGSDTTEDVVEKVLVNPQPGGAADNGLYNIISRYDNNSSEFVPGEAGLCPDRTYYTTGGTVPPVGPTLAPNGSTAGRNALRDVLNDSDANNNGCIDAARSSSTPRSVGASGDRATFQYSAWGLDFFSWSSASLNAPTELTLAEIRGIYNCTFTDWSQVGGTPGAIQRVVPQPGSGSFTYWRDTVLGFDPLTTPAVLPPGCGATINLRDDGGPLNEHAGREVPVSAYQTAIFPYSGGQWAFQANSSINPTLDKRNGFQLRQITAEATFTASTSSGSTTLTTAVNNRFTNINLSGSVTGAGIPAGTTITAISANGQTATMSQAATADGTPLVTVVSLPSSGVRWLTIGTGGWLPNTPTGANPRGAVSEAQVRINNPVSELLFLRYMFNVVDSGSPQFVAARAAVGFQNTAAGVKSTFCDGTSSTKILDGGFAPLSSTTPQGVDPARNLNGSTCRAYTP